MALMWYDALKAVDEVKLEYHGVMYQLTLRPLSILNLTDRRVCPV